MKDIFLTLREKYPNTIFFLVHIFLFQSEYWKIRTKKNSAVGHFLPCVINRNLEILLRQNSQFCKPRINTVFHGTESISNVGPKIWKLLPSILDRYVTWMNFKRSLKNGDLRIVLVDCAKILFKMSALCKI